jgi:hypothetical protein
MAGLLSLKMTRCCRLRERRLELRLLWLDRDVLMLVPCGVWVLRTDRRHLARCMRDTGEMLGREKRLGIEMNKIPEHDY